MSDIFEEVEEEVRRAHYEALWKKYGQFILAGAVAVVVGIAVWQWYQGYDSRQRAAVSDSFQAAQALAASGKFADAEKAFASLADSAPSGYRLIAKFRQAEMLQSQNKLDEAAAAYADIAAANDSDLAASAKLRMASIHAESKSPADVEKDIAELAVATNPWRFLANEVLAYADLKSGKKADAVLLYKQILGDSAAPQGLRVRASAVLEYLNANPNEIPTAAAAAAPAAPPAPAAQEKPAQ